MSKILRVYLASPHRSDDPAKRAEYAALNKRLCRWVTRHGKGKLFPVSPHALTEHLVPEDMPEEYYMAGVMEVCLSCPVMIAFGESEGVIKEFKAHDALYGSSRQWWLSFCRENDIASACRYFLDIMNL